MILDASHSVGPNGESDLRHPSESSRGVKLVAIGGGTGLSTLLAGLKRLVGKGGNEEKLWWLEGIAAQAAAGGPQHIGPACYNPAVWEVYRPAIAAVVQALREAV